jgi:sulfite reductase (NADPH) hemoprotein beta-component
LADLQRAHDIGEMKIKISGCINACGHHHGGHIGILGVDKKGEELCQTALGGDATETAALGTLVGPAFPSDEGTVETIIATDLDQRQNGERFLDIWRRTGIKPFKEKLYAPH